MSPPARLVVVLFHKVMFLGVVAKPVESKNFDGKIFLDRVAEYGSYKKTVYCERFSDDGALNAALRDGDWMQVVKDNEEQTLGDLRHSLAENYFLDDDIASRIVLRSYRPTGKDGKRKPHYLAKEDDVIPSSDRLKAGGYTLMVQYLGKTKTRTGDKRWADVSCDSTYMARVMPEVGKKIREAYHWVPDDVPIFLYLDNAGGHGTQEVVDKYVRDLKRVHNVICVHQRPCSPATIMLDLCAWMAI